MRVANYNLFLETVPVRLSENVIKKANKPKRGLEYKDLI